MLVRSRPSGSELVPVTVHLGQDITSIRIIDDATALDYMFSVVQPPSDFTVFSWDEYWLPMLLLFSKCLYMASATYHVDEEVVYAGVPIMANVMYLPSASATGVNQERQPFMFGATLPRYRQS
jgi:hypothetical protein